jgi:hypothetical protein
VRRKQVSNALFGLGLLVMVLVPAVRLWRDGSFWIDEASVALSFKSLSLPQVFDRLLGSQSFPRWYFLAIRGLQEIFSYQTWVLRLLPFAFSIAAATLWLRLLRLRLGRAPELLAVAILLNLIPATWFAYSAMLKQYTFDVFVALIPFCLSDAFFERSIREGRRSSRVFLVTALCAFSYTYVIALLGRVGGWYLAGLRRDGWRCGVRGVGIFGAGVALFMASLWITDLQYTVGQPAVSDFWSSRVIGEDWSHNCWLLNHMVVGWYKGRIEFSVAGGLPPLAILALQLCAGLGLFAIVRRLARGAGSEERPPEALGAWGSRSVGCLVAILGLVVASPLMTYPVTAGRLTLFLLFPLQMLIVEGLCLLHTELERWKIGRWARVGAALLLVVAMSPVAARNVSGLVTRDVESNFRPLAQHIRERSELTVLATSCSQFSVSSFPGGLGAPVRYLPLFVKPERDLPHGEEFWLLNASDIPYCRRLARRLSWAAASSEAYHTEENTAQLFRLRFPERLESRPADVEGDRGLEVAPGD